MTSTKLWPTNWDNISVGSTRRLCDHAQTVAQMKMSKQAPNDRGKEGKKGTRSLGNTFVFLYFPICQFSHNPEHERRPTTRTKREKLLRLFLCAAAAFLQLVASHADTNINYDIRWKCLLFLCSPRQLSIVPFLPSSPNDFQQTAHFLLSSWQSSDKLTSACTLRIPLVQIITVHGWLGIRSFLDIVSDENFIFCHIPQVIKEWLVEMLSSQIEWRRKYFNVIYSHESVFAGAVH